MDRITCGPGTARIVRGNGAIVRANFGGVLTPCNAGALSALMLAAAVERGAQGVLGCVHGAVTALPPIIPAHYGCVPEPWRLVPVAVVVSEEQLPIYAGIGTAGAKAGVIRRAFVCVEQAEAWLRVEAPVWAEVRAQVLRRPVRPAACGTSAGTAASQANPVGRAVGQSSGQAS